MQLRSDAATADMYAMKAEGVSIAQIAKLWNMKPSAIYKRLNRSYGAGIPRGAPRAANDNNPDRVTRLVAHNGGCSTTSGRMPVSVVRVAANDNHVDEDMRAGAVVTEYALRVAA
jgi:hypothetical protein